MMLGVFRVTVAAFDDDEYDNLTISTGVVTQHMLLRGHLYTKPQHMSEICHLEIAVF